MFKSEIIHRFRLVQKQPRKAAPKKKADEFPLIMISRSKEKAEDPNVRHRLSIASVEISTRNGLWYFETSNHKCARMLPAEW